MPCYIPYHASKGDGDDDFVVDLVDDDDVVDVVEDDGDVSLSQVSWGKRRKRRKRRRRREKGDGVGASLNCVALSNQILYYKYKYKCINRKTYHQSSASHQRMPPNRYTITMLHVQVHVDIRHTFILNLFELIAMQMMVPVMLQV